jgi:hypothetical protein
VIYKEKPVPGGLVTFRPVAPGHNPVNTYLDEEGRYELRVPVGEVVITVDNRELEPQGKGPPPSLPGVKLPPIPAKGEAPQENPSAVQWPPGKYVQIPEKYARDEETDLKYTVKSGSQTHNIELK